MTTVTVTYEGSDHCRAVHGPTGESLITDLPRDVGGRGEFFSPTDLVAAALGACMLTIMAQAVRDRGIDLSGARIEVTKEMAPAPARRIRRLHAVLHLPAVPAAEDRRRLERAALTCPVHRTLEAAVELSVAFRYA